VTNHARTIHKTALTIFTAALVIVGTGGCGDDSDLPPAASPPATTSEAPGLDLTPAEQEAVDEARTTFDNFMNAYVEDATTGEPFETEMGPVIGGRPLEYLTGTLTQEVQSELVENRNENRVFAGSLTWNFVEVDNVDLDRTVQGRSVPTVRMSYCVDTTNWIIVDKDTGDPVGRPSARQIQTVEAVWFDDDGGARDEGWRFANREALQESSC
jgi:hypothetical protein